MIPGPGFNRINRIFIPTNCNFFSGNLSPKNSEVKRAWPGAISGWVTDREVLSGVRTSEDKVCRKDMCWSVRIVCVLESCQM